MDIYEICLNEIALEGLDGITLSTLWLRFAHREEKNLVKLTENLKRILWMFLLQNISVDFFQIENDRDDPAIFNRYLGVDIASGQHTAMAPDELDLLQDVYPVKPVTHAKIKGSCVEFDSRINITDQLRSEKPTLDSVVQIFGERRLVIVGKQDIRESALRGTGITPQTIEDLTDVEYCILERIGRSRWQGEIQNVLNGIFGQMKASHIHYMMKSLFSKGLVTKQAYSYKRADKANKVYQQVLLHIPQYKHDARSMSDIRVDTVCEILKQSENQTSPCADLKQIIGAETNTFKKLVQRMVNAGYVKMECIDPAKTYKHSDKLMILIKTPSEKQEGDSMADEVVTTTTKENDHPGLVAEIPMALQGHRIVISAGENGCSQNDLMNMLPGYGSLEARHICRKMERSKVVKMIMVDRGKQRAQKYIAKDFATSSLHTKQFLAEKKKMKTIMATSGMAPADEASIEPSQGAQLNLSLHNTTIDESLAEKSIDATNQETELSGDHSLEINGNTENVQSDAIADNEATEDSQESSLPRCKRDVHQTARKMKRTNLILSFINELKIVEGFFAIQKVLQIEEKSEGITTKICKKTVKRTIMKMCEDGLIKYFTIPITSNEQTIEVDFIMALDCDSSRLKTAIEQAQFKKYADDSKKIAEQADIIDVTLPTNTSPTLQHSLSLNDSIKVEDMKSPNKLQYGFQPKFLRTQIVHEYLWYLAYGHPYNNKDSLEMLDYDKVREYSKERNWKRFLPPAPQHPDQGPGWLQVGDVAVLLPLSVICQFHQYSYKIDGLEHYLNSSLQKSTLVRHLPNKVKSLLLHKRKYLFSLVQVIETLCFMGLITISQQKKMKANCLRKEEEMIYVHKNLTIVDTRKSGKSYCEVSVGIDYEELGFKLENFSSVEKYWMKLKDICLMTPLGVRISDDNDQEPLRRNSVYLKKFISEHISRKDPSPRDDGSIPGDHRGAGGLDSSLFSHLYRNWFRTFKSTRNVDNNETTTMEHASSATTTKEHPRRLPKLIPSVINLTETTSKKIKKKPAKPVELKGAKETQRKRKTSHLKSDASTKRRRVSKFDYRAKVVDSSSVTENHENATKLMKNSKTMEGHCDSSDIEFEVTVENNIGRNHRVKGGRGGKRKNTSEPNAVVKKKKKVQSKEKRERSAKVKYIDILDQKARSNLKGRFRVAFTSAEDEILLMCKISSTIISKNVKIKGKHDATPVSGIAIRNILQEHCAESDDKTSYSCLRRIRCLIKNRTAQICHDVSVAEILEDDEFMHETFKCLDETDNTALVTIVEELFKKVFSEVQKRFKNHDRLSTIELPDTIEQLEDTYNVKVVTSSKKLSEARVVSDITSPRHVVLCVLENLMYATLSLNEDEFSQYQAYKIFENYAQETITEVWEHIKKSGIVCKKADHHLSRQRHLPFTVPTFHLSKLHFQSFQAHLIWKICNELSMSLEPFNKQKKLNCNMNCTSGPVVLMNMLLLTGKAHFDVNYPSTSSVGNMVTGNSMEDDKHARIPAESANPVSHGVNVVKSRSNVRLTTADEAALSDGDDTSSAGETSKKELYLLYRRKRFANCFNNNNDKKSVFPVAVVTITNNRSEDCETNVGHSKDDSIWKNYESDLICGISCLSSKKQSNNQVISLIEDRDEVSSLIQRLVLKDPALESVIKHVVNLVENTGVPGIPVNVLKTKLLSDPLIHSHLLEACIDLLCEKEIIYIVGMHSQRFVMKKYSSKWFVNGSVFKGDRRDLREQIRKELTGTTKRHDGKHLESAKSSKKFGELIKALSYSDDDEATTARVDQSASSYQTENIIASSNDVIDICHSDGDDVEIEAGQSAHVSQKTAKTTNDVTCLLDSSNYEQVTFICRPWHNVSGDVNYKTAKLMLSGVFIHILWNAGITLDRLSQHFLSIMQPTSLIELVKTLVSSKCVMKRVTSPVKPWRLFCPIAHDDAASTSENTNYTVALDGILRMASLCKRLDELHKSREGDLSSHTSKYT